MQRIALLLILVIINIRVSAGNVESDTLVLSLQDAEQIFLKNNLSLLAARFDIEASRAQVVQSRLYDNPTVYLEQNIYNQYTRKAFDVTSTGQNIVQVQQLFLLAGKRNKRIEMSGISSRIAEYQFYDLLRTLRYELHASFYHTYFGLQTVKMYDEEIASLNRTLDILEILISKGAISTKEMIRIRSLLFSLESERLEIVKKIHEQQTTLNILLNLEPNKFIFPQINTTRFDSLAVLPFPLASLQDSALANRLDLKIYDADINFQEANLAYQRALAIPDVRVGGIYDRAGSYIPNYTGVSLQIDLPAWNRNQGNIAMARTRKDQSVTLYQHYRQQVITEVNEAYRKAEETMRVYKTFDKNIGADFDKLKDMILVNYEKRNISLIEFIDYYQAYKTMMLELNRLRNDKVQAIEQLNYYTGKKIIE